MKLNTKCPFHVFMAGVVSTILLSTTIASAAYVYHRVTSTRKRIPKALLNAGIYRQELLAAVEVALAAGVNIKTAIEEEKKISSKGNVDFVTETDKGNEKLIINALHSQFPSYSFIGEEGCSEENHIPSFASMTTPTWVVDPVDGTTNFVHRFPLTCVSIALVVCSEVVLAVVYDPLRDELFTAIKGHGSYCNLTKMSVSGCSNLNQAMVLTEFGYHLESDRVRKMITCAESVMNSKIHAMRSLGSGVLDLCYVAKGRLDCLYSGVAGEGWKPWDYAAGSLLVLEAGGVMSGVDGSSFDVEGKSVLAASCENLKNELVSVISQASQRF